MMETFYPLVAPFSSEVFDQEFGQAFASKSFSKFGSSSLHLAVLEGNLDKVLFLLKRGANANQLNACKESPLHWACKGGYIEIIKALIVNGAKLNLKDNMDCTPLHWAVDNDQPQAVEFLMNHGADISVKNSCSKTPYQLACDIGFEKMLQTIEDNK